MCMCVRVSICLCERMCHGGFGGGEGHTLTYVHTEDSLELELQVFVGCLPCYMGAGI